MKKNVCLILFVFIRVFVNSQNYPKTIIKDDTTYFVNDLELLISQQNDSVLVTRIKINDSTFLWKTYNLKNKRVIGIKETNSKGLPVGNSIKFDSTNKQTFFETYIGTKLKNRICINDLGDTIGYKKLINDSIYECYGVVGSVYEHYFVNIRNVNNGIYIKSELNNNKILKQGTYKVMTSSDIIDNNKYEKLLKKYGYANMYENKYFERSLPIGTWYIRNEKDQLIKIKYDWKGCIKGF